MVKLPVFRPDAPERIEETFPTDLIQTALTKVSGCQKVLAGHLKLSTTRMSRIVHGARLGLLNCLQLAVFLREDPAVVLRVYRHARLIELLRCLYVERGYVPRERARVHAALDRLPSDELRLVAALIDHLLSTHGVVVRDAPLVAGTTQTRAPQTTPPTLNSGTR